MNEKFHYLINFLFVPALSPLCPRFVPGTFPAQTLVTPCFFNLSPVSPAFFDSLGEGFARWHKKTARPGDGGAAGVGGWLVAFQAAGLGGSISFPARRASK